MFPFASSVKLYENFRSVNEKIRIFFKKPFFALFLTSEMCKKASALHFSEQHEFPPGPSPRSVFAANSTDYVVLIRVFFFCFGVGGDDLLLDIRRDKVIVAERHRVAAASAGYTLQLARILGDFCQRHQRFNG